MSRQNVVADVFSLKHIACAACHTLYFHEVVLVLSSESYERLKCATCIQSTPYILGLCKVGLEEGKWTNKIVMMNIWIWC